jgi:hypothetical protein
LIVMKWWMVVAGVLLLLIGALVGAWCSLGFDLGKMSALGDALGPLVGVLSLGAVLAALYSVHLQRSALRSQDVAVSEQLRLQREALAKQDDEIKRNAQAIAEQIELQRAALQKQDEQIKQQAEANQEERMHRWHLALREAYAPLLVAAKRYLDAADTYTEWLRANYHADKNQRRAQQGPVFTAYGDVERAAVDPELLDPDGERHRARYLATCKVDLEPALDTSATQRRWCEVIRYESLCRRTELGDLKFLLGAAFGRPYEESAEIKKHVAMFLDRAKEAADAARAEIAELQRG